MQKPEKSPKPWQMGTHLRMLGESFPMSTKKTGFKRFSKMLAFFLLRANVASALEGLLVP